MRITPSPDLNGGAYKIAIEKTGPNTAVLSGIHLQVAEKKGSDVQLVCRSGHDYGRVEGTTTKLDTDAATVGSIASQSELVNMPLYGRDFSRAAFLIPGTRAERARDFSTGGDFLTSPVNVGASGGGKNAFNLDGVDNSMTGHGGPALNFFAL